MITAVEKAHIGYLGSIEAIADEKAEILRPLEPGGIAVLPADTPMLPRLRAAAGSGRIVTFGAAPTADVRLAQLAMSAEPARHTLPTLGYRPGDSRSIRWRPGYEERLLRAEHVGRSPSGCANERPSIYGLRPHYLL